MYCRKCGNLIKDGNSFCGKCGTEVLNSNNNSVENEEKKEYVLPPFSLLSKSADFIDENKDISKKLIEKVDNVLKNFNIKAKANDVIIGPLIIQINVILCTGEKVNKISSIYREIGMALGTSDVNVNCSTGIENTIIIEIPNLNDRDILLSDVLNKCEDDSYLKMGIPLFLGKDVIGNNFIIDLKKYPFLLVGGSTGTGKSMLLKSIIMSFVLTKRPDELRLLLIDNKNIEFNEFNCIGNLVCPVVYDVKQSMIAIQKILIECEKRLHMFTNTGTGNIDEFNKFVMKWNDSHPNEKLESMPYFVLIIDEIFDLMMYDKKSVEMYLRNLTSNYENAGVYCIISTQRPSNNVITNLIKLSFSDRISFKVSSNTDSRVILDTPGAEKLLASSDFIFKKAGAKEEKRIKGLFISDEDIFNITNFINQNNSFTFDDSFIKFDNESSDDCKTNFGATDDELYNEIVRFVVTIQKASASLIQRKFKIGYNKAAQMIDLLEENGIIGPSTGNSKPREVLVQFSDD